MDVQVFQWIEYLQQSCIRSNKPWLRHSRFLYMNQWSSYSRSYAVVYKVSSICAKWIIWSLDQRLRMLLSLEREERFYSPSHLYVVLLQKATKIRRTIFAIIVWLMLMFTKRTPWRYSLPRVEWKSLSVLYRVLTSTPVKTFRMDWNTSHITQHQCLTSLMLMLLNEHNCPQPCSSDFSEERRFL